VDGKNSAELIAVRHVVHVPSARRIVEDRRIKAGLVYDESRLNKSRINVAWVSANTWSLGSIYGTVGFQFDWADLIAGQNVYWVEAMDYRPKAYRLLLSGRDIPSGLIVPYDPEKYDGPLKFKDGKYYWNAEFTSEFMIEDDLLLAQCTGVDFVLQHRQYCRPFKDTCDDRKNQPSPQRTGGRVLAFMLGNALHVLDKHLKAELSMSYEGLVDVLGSPGKFGGVIGTADQCEDIARGSLALYGIDQIDQARKLLSLISTKQNFEKALIAIVRSHFDDPSWNPPPF
jgi:hypothetical protein